LGAPAGPPTPDLLRDKLADATDTRTSTPVMKRKQCETRSRYEMTTSPTVDEPGKSAGQSLRTVCY
jgi:hypothetical protein